MPTTINKDSLNTTWNFDMPRALEEMVLCVLLMLTAGCSSVTSYQKPVTDFATATSNAEAAINALNLKVTHDYDEYLRHQIAAGELLVRYENSDCELTSDRCRLVATNKEMESIYFPPPPVFDNLLKLMSGISTYADGLNQIVTADTGEKVARSVNNTLSSIESISTTLGNPLGSGVSAYKTSVGKAFKWILGQYVAKLQIDGLRQATSRAEPVISQATTIFETATRKAEDLAFYPLVKDFDTAWKNYETTLSQMDLNVAIKTASDYDNKLRSRPSSIFPALKAAHTALAMSLQGEDVSVVEAIAKIDAFTTQVNTVREIVKEIMKSENS